ncbi:hypothetical protein [Streptomyces griseoaurantiacus]|uniref:hypothetical protein n=1 Tax=Streptomyces griseoaurantiacus TaxID=68213 RepID=UPI000682BD55|nr:hypothetical protein [Streptomyces griseoaurantiacus]
MGHRGGDRPDRVDGPPGRRRRIRVATGAAVAALLVAGSAAVALSGGGFGDGSGTRTAASDPSARTARVIRTDLSNSRTLEGTLGHGAATTVRGGGEGRITWLPSSGTTVTRGKTLYRVDDRPVPVLYGDLPLYRPLRAVNTVGRDVRVLADNLLALGYAIGPQPAPGRTVVPMPAGPGPRSGPGSGSEDQPAGRPEKNAAGRNDAPDGKPSPEGRNGSAGGTASEEGTASAGKNASAGQSAPAAPVSAPVRVEQGDAVLTTDLINAVKRWQTAIGAPATGVVDPHDVVVLTGPMRVESLQAQVGDPAAGELLKATATGKAVTVPVEAGDAGGIARDQHVTVHLPDDSTAAGRVASVSTAAEAEGDDSAPKVDVLVTFEDASKVKRFDAGPVQVEFVGETRRHVLAVPVTALLALREGGYGVQLSRGRLIAVTTGLFAKGQVEVSGAGLAEGARVVVAS